MVMVHIKGSWPNVWPSTR